MSDSNTIADFHLVQIDTITIEDRSREIDPTWADALASMFKAGEMLHPITLWKDEKGPRLVAGAHRIEAHKINGETHIPAKWSKAKTYAEAKLLETMENIGRRELGALDRARHLSDLKTAFEEVHPETKAGVAGANAKHGDANEIFSFAEDTAAKVGLGARAIQLAVAMWKGLSDASKKRIKGSWLADHQAGLKSLSEQDAKTQTKALDMMFPTNGKPPKAANVADALYIIENGRTLTSVEKKFAGLNKTISGLKDEELDAVLTANEERIAAWFERRVGGDAK